MPPSVLLLAEGLAGWWPGEWPGLGRRNAREPALRLATLATLGVLVIAEAANTAISFDAVSLDRPTVQSRLRNAIEPGSPVLISGLAAGPEVYFSLRGRNPMRHLLPFYRNANLPRRTLLASRYFVGDAQQAPGPPFVPSASIHAAGTVTVVYRNRDWNSER